MFNVSSDISVSKVMPNETAISSSLPSTSLVHLESVSVILCINLQGISNLSIEVVIWKATKWIQMYLINMSRYVIFLKINDKLSR